MKVCQVEGRQKLGDKWGSRPYIVVKKQPNTPVYVVRLENGDAERVVHRNLLTQCMFLPVERPNGRMEEGVEAEAEEDVGIEDTEDTREQADDVTTQGDELNRVQEMEVDNTEETGQMSDGGEGQETATNKSLPLRPRIPRRNAPRNRRPPEKLSYELQAVESELDQQNFERGRDLHIP